MLGRGVGLWGLQAKESWVQFIIILWCCNVWVKVFSDGNCTCAELQTSVHCHIISPKIWELGGGRADLCSPSLTHATCTHATPTHAHIHTHVHTYLHQLPILYHWAIYNKRPPPLKIYIYSFLSRSVCMNNYQNSDWLCYPLFCLVTANCDKMLMQEKTLNMAVSQKLYTRLLFHEWTALCVNAWHTNGNLYHACIQQVKP